MRGDLEVNLRSSKENKESRKKTKRQVEPPATVFIYGKIMFATYGVKKVLLFSPTTAPLMFKELS